MKYAHYSLEALIYTDNVKSYCDAIFYVSSFNIFLIEQITTQIAQFFITLLATSRVIQSTSTIIILYVILWSCDPLHLMNEYIFK